MSTFSYSAEKSSGGRGLSRGNSPPELGRGRSLEFDVRKMRRTGGVKKKRKKQFLLAASAMVDGSCEDEMFTAAV